MLTLGNVSLRSGVDCRLSFATPLFMMATKRPLETKDLGETPVDVKASSLHNSFETAWKKECEKPPENRSLFRTLMRIVGWGKANCVVTIYTLSSLIKLVPSLLLSALIDDFDTDSLGTILRIGFHRRTGHALVLRPWSAPNPCNLLADVDVRRSPVHSNGRKDPSDGFRRNLPQSVHAFICVSLLHELWRINESNE